MSGGDMNTAASIIKDAGGKIVGRTRLQKISYLLHVTGLEQGFNFTYKHYGPFSEQLADATEMGVVLSLIDEQKTRTDWGATYSTYSTKDNSQTSDVRAKLATKMVKKASIDLELAATAVYLFYNGYEEDPWKETEERKPEKATPSRIKSAKNILKELGKVEVPCPIPSELYQ